MDRFEQLSTFVRVVELRGFSAAARDLGVAPSVITTHIQALEQRLGARLLNRNTHTVKPTEVGDAYYRRCVDLLSRFEQADGLVESMQATPRGVLRVNTSILVPDLIMPAVSDYTAKFPDVTVRLIATGRHVDFIEEQFDVAIRHTLPANGSLITRKLAELELILCTSPKYFANRPPPRDPDDLAAHNCIVYTDSEHGDRWPIFQSHPAVTVHGNLQTNSLMVLLKAAESGQGIVVFPRFAAERAIARGELIEVLPDYPKVRRPISAIHPHRGLVPTKTTVFIDMVGKYLQKALAPGSAARADGTASATGARAKPKAARVSA
jgi:DNA-binding transcriptional LysR family regulator